MKKIAILGCENSHCDMFLRIIKKSYSDIEVLGVYSHDEEASRTVAEKHGVYAAKSYDEFVGKVDGIIITARHGDRHYMYAKPYLASKIPLFIDKPTTINEHEAVEFMNILKENKIPACGGSICVFADHILSLKEKISSCELGAPIGGYLRAPLISTSEHGGFYFYAQHLVQITSSLFGYYPKSVLALRSGDTVTVITRYDNFDITAVFFDNRSPMLYYAGVNFEKGVVGNVFTLENAGEREFETFYDILCGREQEMSYDDMFASVFIMNAIERSLESGKEEVVRRAADIK